MVIHDPIRDKLRNLTAEFQRAISWQFGDLRATFVNLFASRSVSRVKDPGSSGWTVWFRANPSCIAVPRPGDRDV